MEKIYTLDRYSSKTHSQHTLAHVVGYKRVNGTN
jgi:hypothetical protein